MLGKNLHFAENSEMFNEWFFLESLDWISKVNMLYIMVKLIFNVNMEHRNISSRKKRLRFYEQSLEKN